MGHDPSPSWEDDAPISEPPSDVDGYGEDGWPIEEPQGFNDEPPFYDEPPYDAPPHGGPSDGDAPRGSAERIGDAVRRTIREVIAAQHGKPLSQLADIVLQIQSADRVLDKLDEDVRGTFDNLAELLLDTARLSEGGTTDLTYMPIVRLYGDDVRTELDAIAALIGDPSLPPSPNDAWFAIKEQVQRNVAQWSAQRYIEAIQSKYSVEDTMKRFRSIEAPTTKRAITRKKAGKTAREVMAEKRAVGNAAADRRYSFGYRTLDIALTPDGSPYGSIAPGEGMVIGGPTGTGKSSFSYGILPSLTQDVVNYGFPDAKVLFFHTEEESEAKIIASGFDEGQQFHHLADNLVVVAVGTSRVAIVETVYDAVIEAKRLSFETGRPIDQFLPHVLVLDYLQSIKEAGENLTDATFTTAEFLMRGVQAWDPEEMAKFSGVDFQSYAGMPWPEGMVHHRVAVITFAQLVKQSTGTLFYKPGKRDSQLSDFVLEDDKGTPMWDVREGDLRLFTKGDIKGSSQVLDNATTILILHRSSPYNNPSFQEDGRPRLSDRRARLILDKVRTGSNLAYVPMEFDLRQEKLPDGRIQTRGRYVDFLAEKAMAAGQFVPYDCFLGTSDPLLPPRAKKSPLADARYG